MVLPLLTGRGVSPIRTPILIRDYLTGQGAFSDDPPEELAERLVEGAYVAQIHQRIKQYIRETRPKYQWPRRHSFHARINDLLMLGLLVETGRREDPQQRGAGRLGTASRVDALGVVKRGFNQRMWVRLAPGVEAKPEWADPLGYLILLKQKEDPSSYQNIRPAGRVLSTAVQVSQPALRPVEPAPVQQRAEPAREALERFRELEQERQALHEAAETLSLTGISPNSFNRLGRDVRQFNTTAIRVLGGTPFPDLAEALEILQNCVARLAAQRQMTQQRVQALNFCRSAAGLLAEALPSDLSSHLRRSQALCQRLSLRPRHTSPSIYAKANAYGETRSQVATLSR